VIAVEGGDEPDERRDGLRIALVNELVDNPQRLMEPRHLHPGVALGRVEPPLVDRPVEFASHGRDADLERRSDHLVVISGRDHIENRFAQRKLLFPPGLAPGAQVGALGMGSGVVVHGRLLRRDVLWIVEEPITSP